MSPSSEQIQTNNTVYGSNISSPYISSGNQNFTTSHANHHFNNLTNIERPSSSFVKQSSKYSISEVKTSPDVK